MATTLPDEIVLEILSPALKVSDELFLDTSYVSPFANYTPSTSAYLLVCKDWLRVATPLLFHVVVSGPKLRQTHSRRFSGITRTLASLSRN